MGFLYRQTMRLVMKKFARIGLAGQRGANAASLATLGYIQGPENVKEE